MILLFVVGIWVVVLGPSLLRRRAEARSTDSIGTFHRQLGVLQRAGPSLVPAAHRLETCRPSPAPATGLPFVSSRGGHVAVRQDAAGHRGEVSGPGSTHRRPDPYFRAGACKRRRDVLVGLAGTVAGTAILGAALPPLLIVSAIAVACLGGYVALLVHMRRLALERQTKLRFLPQHAPVASSSVRAVAAR